METVRLKVTKRYRNKAAPRNKQLPELVQAVDKMNKLHSHSLLYMVIFQLHPLVYCLFKGVPISNSALPMDAQLPRLLLLKKTKQKKHRPPVTRSLIFSAGAELLHVTPSISVLVWWMMRSETWCQTMVLLHRWSLRPPPLFNIDLFDGDDFFHSALKLSSLLIIVDSLILEGLTGTYGPAADHFYTVEPSKLFVLELKHLEEPKKKSNCFLLFC